MRYFFYVSLFLFPLAMQADIAEEVMETPIVEEKKLAVDDQADLYDRQYNLNPVPQNPRTSEPPAPGSCKYASALSEEVDKLETRVADLEKKVAALEQAQPIH